MAEAVERFSLIGGVVVVEGWSSDYGRGLRPQLLHAGAPMQTVSEPMPRPDLIAAHGAEAQGWGFRACGLGAGETLRAEDIGLRFDGAAGGGAHLASLSALRDRSLNTPRLLMERFFAEVNAAGGTVLEIGARARSGHTARDRFGEDVRYIGVDIAEGPNVDIVADAHRLSEAVPRGIDYVFSVSTFEHFLMPWKVALEINAVLKPGGKVMCHSHQSWPMHDEPWDYFRFSPEAWGGLFNAHTGFRLCAAERGQPVAIVSAFNPGGPFDGLDAYAGYAMSVCVAQKISEPLVAWPARVEDLQVMEYRH